jgi:vanillate O-demethylase monooxygenase subunit
VWNRTWVAVAHAAEIPDNTPMQVLVAGEAWVVTRMDGVLTAFEDRCPHRQSPLSAGSVTRADDGSPRLLCAVHGWRFDAAGQCDLMPTEGRTGRGRGHDFGRHGRHHGWHGRHGDGRHGDGRHDRTPDAVRLRGTYGITERYGLVWLAVDEPLAPLPEFPEWAGEATDRAHCRPVRVQASAGQVIDSFLDAASTISASTVSGCTITADGWRVTGVTESTHGDDGQAGARDRCVTTAGPSATAHLRLELPRATVGILITAQPEEWGLTRVYKLITRDDLGGDPALVEKFAADEDRALTESLAILQRSAVALLPLDEEAPAGTTGGQLNLAWRSLMARAVQA